MPIGGEQLGLLVLGGEPTASQTIEEAVRRLVDDGVDTRLVTWREQRGDLPVICYRVDDEEAELQLDGETAYAVARFEFQIFSESYADLRRIGKQIFDVLSGFRGQAWDRVILTALFVDQEDDIEEREDGREGCVYVRSQFYEVTYLE